MSQPVSVSGASYTVDSQTVTVTGTAAAGEQVDVGSNMPLPPGSSGQNVIAGPDGTFTATWTNVPYGTYWVHADGADPNAPSVRSSQLDLEHRHHSRAPKSLPSTFLPWTTSERKIV